MDCWGPDLRYTRGLGVRGFGMTLLLWVYTSKLCCTYDMYYRGCGHSRLYTLEKQSQKPESEIHMGTLDN